MCCYILQVVRLHRNAHLLSVSDVTLRLDIREQMFFFISQNLLANNKNRLFRIAFV